MTSDDESLTNGHYIDVTQFLLIGLGMLLNFVFITDDEETKRIAIKTHPLEMDGWPPIKRNDNRK